MDRVKDKVAIVTGATSRAGIGYAIARSLAREGAAVALTGTNEAEILARAHELVAEGGRAFGCRHEVARECEWETLVARTVETFGKVDILVNNAAISRPRSIEDADLETWHRVIDVNLTGAFLGCKHAVLQMRKQGTGGSIINISSIGGYDGLRKGSSYGSSKAGMRQLSKVVAVENGTLQIRCNTIIPGVVVTDIFKPFLAENPRHLDNHRAANLMGRLGDPDDIAYAALYLASDEAKYVTGTDLIVDGGQTVR